MQEVPVPDHTWEVIPVRAWANNTYLVLEFELSPTTEGEGPLTHLLVRRHDFKASHDWRHLQWIKNDVCGPEREGMEMFPAESRLVDTMNQYHLWVLPAGESWPLGYTTRSVSNGTLGTQRPFPVEATQEPVPGKKVGGHQRP